MRCRVIVTRTDVWYETEEKGRRTFGKHLGFMSFVADGLQGVEDDIDVREAFVAGFGLFTSTSIEGSPNGKLCWRKLVYFTVLRASVAVTAWRFVRPV